MGSEVSLLEFFILIPRIFFLWFLSILQFFRQFICPKRKNVSGEVTVITGAGSGLGRLLCVEFSQLGARVVCWDINQDALKVTQDLVESSTGVRPAAYVCDVGDPKAVYQTAEQVVKDLGDNVGILVNNAGVVNGTLLLNTTDENIMRTFKVNVLSHFYTVKACLPGMLTRGRGHIVFVASCAGMTGAPRVADYCASKAADILLAECLDAELEFSTNSIETGRTVALTTVAPYFIKTGMFDGCASKFKFLLPDLQPEYVVQRIMEAVLAEQKFVAIPRIIYWLVTIKSMLPVSAQMDLARLCGVDCFMDSFIGKSKAD